MSGPPRKAAAHTRHAQLRLDSLRHVLSHPLQVDILEAELQMPGGGPRGIQQIVHQRPHPVDLSFHPGRGGVWSPTPPAPLFFDVTLARLHEELQA